MASRTAVDTNVFVALFAGDEKASPRAQRNLEDAAARAALAVSPTVYAELVVGGCSPAQVETFLSDKGIEVDWNPGQEVWRIAGPR